MDINAFDVVIHSLRSMADFLEGLKNLFASGSNTSTSTSPTPVSPSPAPTTTPVQ